MTQKELLYVEDAVEHERIIIEIIEDMTNLLEDESLIDFISKEKKKHSSMKEKLISIMEECTNE